MTSTTRRSLSIIALLAASFAASRACRADESGPIHFETHVRPILKAKCWQCHGEESEKKGGLDTRLARFMRSGGDSGAAIVPGDHRESLLYDRVASGEMPPGNKKLSAREIKLIARWIDSGALTLPSELVEDGEFTEEDRAHWSLQPIVSPPLPTPKAARSLRSPVDAFLLSALEQRGLSYGPEADRPTLIRRLCFDLLGLPPALEAIDRFVDDESPDAYERLVEELLASPAYGERWARHWLDVAGYADSDGGKERDPVRK